jgi:hypothetical protein
MKKILVLLSIVVFPALGITGQALYVSNDWYVYEAFCERYDKAASYPPTVEGFRGASGAYEAVRESGTDDFGGYLMDQFINADWREVPHPSFDRFNIYRFNRKIYFHSYGRTVYVPNLPTCVEDAFNRQGPGAELTSEEWLKVIDAGVRHGLYSQDNIMLRLIGVQALIPRGQDVYVKTKDVFSH